MHLLRGIIKTSARQKPLIGLIQMTTFTHVPVVPTTVELNKVSTYIRELGEMREMVEFNFSGSWNCSPQITFESFKRAIANRASDSWHEPVGVSMANAVRVTFKEHSEFVTLSFFSWEVRLEVRDLEAWIDSFEA